jgi:hypothetical protein
MKASTIVSAATAAMLLCGAIASRADDAPAPPAAPNATQNAAASPSQSATASSAQSATASSAQSATASSAQSAATSASSTQAKAAGPTLLAQANQADNSQSVSQANGTHASSSAVQASASTKFDPSCLKYTGSRIPPLGKCHEQSPGHAWSGKDVQRTGGTDTASSLRFIGDPTLTVNQH